MCPVPLQGGLQPPQQEEAPFPFQRGSQLPYGEPRPKLCFQWSEWCTELSPNLKASTQTAVREAWRKGGLEGLHRLLDKAGGSIHADRLYSITTTIRRHPPTANHQPPPSQCEDGVVVWRNLSLPDAVGDNGAQTSPQGLGQGGGQEGGSAAATAEAGTPVPFVQLRSAAAPVLGARSSGAAAAAVRPRAGRGAAGQAAVHLHVPAGLLRSTLAECYPEREAEAWYQCDCGPCRGWYKLQLEVRGDKRGWGGGR